MAIGCADNSIPSVRFVLNRHFSRCLRTVILTNDLTHAEAYFRIGVYTPDSRNERLWNVHPILACNCEDAMRTGAGDPYEESHGRLEAVSRREIGEIDVARANCAQRTRGPGMNVACLDQNMSVDLPCEIKRRLLSHEAVGIAGRTGDRNARADVSCVLARRPPAACQT